MEGAAEELSSMSSADMENHMKIPGTFAGHFRPGVICLVFGFLWTYNNLFRYHAARREALRNGRDGRKLQYESSLFSKYSENSSYSLVEPYVAIIAGFVTFIAETYGVIFLDQPLALEIHHLLMHTFYSLAAICVICRHYKYMVPPGSEHAIFLVANVAEGYLFWNHHEGGMMQKVHVSISLFNFVTALCVACEIAHRRSILAVLGRTLSFMVQGVWFIIAAFLIYPPSFIPKWDAEEHVKMNIVSTLVVVDVVVVLLIAMSLNAIVSQRVKNLSTATVNRYVVCSSDTKILSVASSDSGKKLLSDSEAGC